MSISQGYYDQSYPKTVLAGPAGTLTTLAPNSVVVNTDTLVTITGTGFLPSARVYVDGIYYPSTVYVSATTVRFHALASAVGTQQITVKNGKTGVASNARPLTVTATGLETEAQAPPDSPQVPQDSPTAPGATETAQEPPGATGTS